MLADEGTHGTDQVQDGVEADFLDMKRRWLKLAESWQFSERISGWRVEIGRRTSGGG